MNASGPHHFQIIKAALTYFALAFGAGFLLGAIRVTLVVPNLGERMAELIEMPVMLIVIVFAARHVARRYALPKERSTTIQVGFLALGLLLAAEILLAVVIQNRSLADYVASRDPVSGSVYLAMLLLFALMPTILAKTKSIAPSSRL